MSNGSQTGILLLVESIREKIDGPKSDNMSVMIHKEMLNFILILDAKDKVKNGQISKLMTCVENTEEQNKGILAENKRCKLVIKELQADIAAFKAVPSISTYLVGNLKKVTVLILSVFIGMLLIIELWVEALAKDYSIIDFALRFFGL